MRTQAWVVLVGALVVGAAVASCGGGGGGASGGATGGGSTGGTGGGTSGGGPGTYDGTLASTSASLEDGSKYVAVTFTASADGTATVTAGSSAFDPVVSIEKTAADGTAVVLAEDDDSGGGTTAKATFAVTAGSHYQAVVTGVAPASAGAFTVTYTKETLAR
ncbi:MAG: hypothetical protein KF857_05225 [Fimbriimonadaceae bacterium]|nr:hypothetical protein [Fimbriimonadaceae bacterium]